MTLSCKRAYITHLYLCLRAPLVALLLFALTAKGQNTITTVAGGGANSSVATSAVIGLPEAVAVDKAGNVYISSHDLQQVFKADTAGNLTVVAGDGSPGFSGDGGPATSASLYQPDGVALDGSGNLFIADYGNAVIRRVDAATGVITTVAGNGTSGFSGDGGPATSASLNGPSGVAVDGSGNLFIADTDNSVIRRVAAATGIITTVAGNGTAGYAGDGNTATNSNLNYPAGVAVDASGNLFIADTSNARIRVVNLQSTPINVATISIPPGTIATIAGGGSVLGDGGPATSAALVTPEGMAVDSAGDLFFADAFADRVRKVAASTGIITTVAGSGTQGYSGDGGAATSADLLLPFSVAVDASGDLYIADTSNNRVRKVVAATGIISTVAGGGSDGDSGPAKDAQLVFPTGVAADASGNLYIADYLAYRIRRVAADTGNITTVAGNGTAGYYGDDGPATSAGVDYPWGVAVDNAANLFIADRYDHVIRRVDASTGNITTVAGNSAAGASFGGDGGPATSASLNQPLSAAVDSSGNLFIADSSNNRIREVAATTGIITTVAGNGTAAYSGDGGPATSASLNQPSGVAVDGSGNLFIADSGNNVIRRVAASSGTITTVAGNHTSGYVGDGGAATSASLYQPYGVAVDASGNFFIADTSNHVIRRVDATSGVITTVAGDGTSGFSGDGGPATSAELYYPTGVALDGASHIIIADTSNNRVRQVVLAPIVTLSSTSLTFSTQLVGGTSAAQTLTVTNGGGANLTISSIAASANFAQTNNCPISPSTLNPGSTCTVNVTFTPTAAGALTGTITITDNAFDSPQTVSLSGQGTAAGVTLSTNSLTFGNQVVGTTSGAQTVTLTNGTSTALTISSITASGDFAVTNNCTSSLAAGASCTINVTFTPTANGSRTGTLTVTDNAPSSPQTVALSGTGATPGVSLLPASLTFAHNIDISCYPKTVTLSNNGNATVNITGIAITANFAIDSGTTSCSKSTPLAPGASCTIGVTFTPIAITTYTGTLTVTDNAPTSPQTVALTGTGLVPCSPLATSSQVVTVMRGTDSADFQISDPKPSCHTTAITLACTQNGPASCSFNPAAMLPTGSSTLTVGNLTSLTDDALHFRVTGTSGAQGQDTTAVDLSVLLEDFSFGDPYPTSSTVTAGQTASYALILLPVNGLKGTVQLSCQGAPAGASCSVSPPTVTLDGASPVHATASVTTTARSLAPPRPGSRPTGGPETIRWISWLLLALLTVAALTVAAVGACPGRDRRPGLLVRRYSRAFIFVGMLLLVIGWVACGGGGMISNSGPTGTPAGSYDLIVTGTYSASGSGQTSTFSHQAKVKLVVN